jgi:hypothetical protein
MCSERIERSHEVTPQVAPRAIDRRDFLKLGGIGLTGVALLGSVGVGTVFAQREPPRGSSFLAEFREVAEEQGFPMEL